MKPNTHTFYHLLNTVKKTNGIKLFLMYEITNVIYFISKLMRALNY
jgi:hypothetical protein